MALPQVGLEAVIANLNSFESGSKSIQKAYDAIQHKAGGVEKATGAMGRAFSGLTGVMGSVAGGLGNIATIAGGIATANIFGRIAQGIGDFTSSGLAAVGAQQTLEAGLGALLTSNNLYEESVQKVTIAHTKELMSAEELTQRNAELTSSIDVQKATIQENRQKLIDLTAKWGDNGLATIRAREQLEQMQVRLQGTELDLKNLTATETTYETQTKTTFNQVMDFKEAQKLAAEQSEQLLKFVDKLSIVSPFERDQVATVSKFAVQAGLGVEAVEKFTAGFLDLAAATGINSANLDFAADQLLQVKKVGQIFEGDLRQLRRIGIDLNRIIGVEMGMSVDEFNAKAKESPEIFDELFAAVGTFANKNFPGAAKRMATTIDGIGSTFKDLIVVAQREFFTPVVEAVTPTAIKMIDTLSGFFLGGGMAELGEKAGQFIADGIAKGMKVISTFKAGGLAVFSEFLGAEGVTLWFKLKDLFKSMGTIVAELGKAFSLVMPSFEGLSTGGILNIIIQGVDLLNQGLQATIPIIQKVIGAFERFGVRGATVSILGQLGLEPSQIGTTLQTIDSVFAQITEAFNVFITEGLFGGVALAGGEVSRTGGLLKLIGLDDETITTIQNVILGIIPFITSHLAELQGAIIGMGAAIAAIGIAGTIISIGIAIAGLVTPVGLIIAAAALLGAAWAGNWGGIQEKTFAVWAIVQPILTQLVGWLSVNVPVALQFLADAWNSILLPAITGFVNFLTGTWFPLQAMWWSFLSNELVESVTLLSTAWTNTLLPALTSVWSFINTVLMPLWVSLINLLTAVVGVGVKALAGLWQNVLKPALVTVGNFIATQLQPAFDAVAKIIDEKVSPSANKLGGDVLPALSKGLQTVIKWIKDATGFFNSLAKAVSNFKLPDVLTPGSPPPFAVALADIAAAANMAGAAMGGFSQATLDKLLHVNRAIASNRNAIGAARDDLEKFFDKSNLGGAKRNLALQVLSNIFKTYNKEILSATDRQAKFQELVNRFGPNLAKSGISGEQGKTFLTGMGLFLNFFDKRKKELILAQQQMFIQAGKTALSIGTKLNDIISGSVDILNQRVESLQALVDSGLDNLNFEGQILSAVQAQNLLNAALAEQASIQDDILQLKQNEQKLSFLEKQLSLIDTLNEAGLDVKDILGGISLGLDASIPDMIEATNRLVMAMINQVNEDLQLGSPSKVMMRKGEQTGMGFVEGIMASIPGITGAMRKAIFGPSVSGPVLSGGNNSRVVNNNFNMNVNSGASPQAVMQQFEVARGMVG